MRALLLPALAALALAPSALAREPLVPCEIAVKLDYATFASIQIPDLGGWSEASEDEASGRYADCRAAQLTASLAKSPKLRDRIAKLRALYRRLSSLDSGIGSMMAGGGTMYGHAIPRSYVTIEHHLASLAALAQTPYGGLAASGGAARLKDLDANFAARLKKLRAAKPTDTLKMVNASLAEWRGTIDDYEKTRKAIAAIAGRTPDIATLAVYEFLDQVMFLDEGP